MGSAKPESEEATTKSYKRDPAVKAWVLGEANGTCEACGTEAPFFTDDDRPFLEVHHVKRLADDGPDIVENAVAICPNCHRALHYSKDRGEIVNRLYETVTRLVRE